MKTTSKDNRPVNLDISTIKLPLAAITSITHRISGVILFVGIGILLWMLDASLESREGFYQLQEHLTSPVATFIVWGVLSALAYPGFTDVIGVVGNLLFLLLSNKL